VHLYTGTSRTKVLLYLNCCCCCDFVSGYQTCSVRTASTSTSTSTSPARRPAWLFHTLRYLSLISPHRNSPNPLVATSIFRSTPSAHLENCGSQRFRRIGLLILSVQIVLLALLRSEPNGQVLVPRQYHPTETPFRTHSCESIDCGFATSTFRHCASTLRTADYTVAVIANRSSSRNLSTFTNTGLLRSTISRPDPRSKEPVAPRHDVQLSPRDGACPKQPVDGVAGSGASGVRQPA
jgi:hypothetical protein